MNVRASFSSRLSSFDMSGFRKVFDRARFIKDPINLSIGQPHFDMPEPLRRAATEAMERGRNSYTAPEGAADVVSFLKERLRADRSLAAEQEVVLTAGAAMGDFFYVLRCYLILGMKSLLWILIF